MEGLRSAFLTYQTTHQPVRSVSLPSRTHPLSVKLRAALNRLSIWQKSSSSTSISTSFGPETLLVGLVNLTELYGFVHELLKCPYVIYTLTHHKKGKLLEDSLDESIVLLDVCEAAREAIVEMRDHMANLKSALRRKGGVAKEAKAYVNLQKKAKKEIAKHIIALKKIETRYTSTNIDQDPALASTSVLSKTVKITISIFRHLLLFLSTIPPPQSLARKMKNNIGFLSISSVSERSLDLIKEMKSLDDVFLGSTVDSRRSFVDVETIQNEKKKKRDVIEDCFRDLETELEYVFKCLVKNRVLFLNILSNC